MIKGNSIILTPILPTDFMNLFRWVDDSEAAKLNEPYRPANWKIQQDWWLSSDNSRVFFAIKKMEGDMIGYLQIMNIDPVHHSASIGIRIGDSFNRGKGYGTDAMKVAIDYCQKTLNLTRITLNVFANNVNAIKMYTKLGFSQEGILRKHVYIDGEYLDVILMAINDPQR